MKNARPNNECGECTACCVVMPVGSVEFSKSAGVPCKHLCQRGCGIYDQRPPVCREWHCLWRTDPWLGSKPDYRPDRLGVMFSVCDGRLTIWEVRPGTVMDQKVDYIKNRLLHNAKVGRGGVTRYPLNVLSEFSEPVADDYPQMQLPPATLTWKNMGNNDLVLVRRGKEEA
jgi:hypothetical protein